MFTCSSILKYSSTDPLVHFDQAPKIRPCLRQLACRDDGRRKTISLGFQTSSGAIHHLSNADQPHFRPRRCLGSRRDYVLLLQNANCCSLVVIQSRRVLNLRRFHDLSLLKSAEQTSTCPIALQTVRVPSRRTAISALNTKTNLALLVHAAASCAPSLKMTLAINAHSLPA